MESPQFRPIKPAPRTLGRKEGGESRGMSTKKRGASLTTSSASSDTMMMVMDNEGRQQQIPSTRRPAKKNKSSFVAVTPSSGGGFSDKNDINLVDINYAESTEFFVRYLLYKITKLCMNVLDRSLDMMIEDLTLSNLKYSYPAGDVFLVAPVFMSTVATGDKVVAKRLANLTFASTEEMFVRTIGVLIYQMFNNITDEAQMKDIYHALYTHREPLSFTLNNVPPSIIVLMDQMRGGRVVKIHQLQFLLQRSSLDFFRDTEESAPPNTISMQPVVRSRHIKEYYRRSVSEGGVGMDNDTVMAIAVRYCQLVWAFSSIGESHRVVSEGIVHHVFVGVTDSGSMGLELIYRTGEEVKGEVQSCLLSAFGEPCENLINKTPEWCVTQYNNRLVAHVMTYCMTGQDTMNTQKMRNTCKKPVEKYPKNTYEILSALLNDSNYSSKKLLRS